MEKHIKIKLSKVYKSTLENEIKLKKYLDERYYTRLNPSRQRNPK
jgi:hypothetical protein